MALDTRDKLISAVASGFTVSLYSSSIANQVAGNFCALWRGQGSPLWGQGAIPTTFVTCTDTLAGGVNLPAFGTTKGYIVRLAPSGATPGTICVYDRLAHIGGLSGTVITAQAAVVNLVTAVAAGRCIADGSDVDWFLEVYTDMGATGVNATVIYRDSGANSRTATAIALGATPRTSRCYQIVPLPGYPICDIVSVTLSATTGTAGNFGVTARRKLTRIGQFIANVCPPGCDGVSLGLPEIKETSCLELVVLCTTTSTGILQGEMGIGFA
jgi:hypothetical protein